MNIGDNIRACRKLKGLSQKEVAMTTGINQAQYSRVESGKVEPTISSLERIAEALGVSLSEFFADKKPLELSVAEQSILERLRLINELEEDERNSVFNIIDGLVSKSRLKINLEKMLKGA